MPEGDTIYRAARTLDRALAGRTVTAFETVLPALARVDTDEPIAGRTVLSVRSAGKHLLMEFSGGLVLRTHMRMNGSWHIYRPGERWYRPRQAMRVVVATDEYVAVGFDIPVAEFARTAHLDRHRALTRLGPDLLAEEFDEAAAAARLRGVSGAEASMARGGRGNEPGPAIADVLLDQRVMAGIGNVFKSEILFVCRIDPFRLAGAISEDEALKLVRTSRELLQANVPRTDALPMAVRGGRQTTRSMNPAARLWVYGRGGRPCRVCGTPIAVRKQGEAARITYWCPTCQSPV